MEDALLVSAHFHARRAAEDTVRARLANAANEHEKAAAQYVKAEQDTSDSEALRILALLEQHHRKLAQIVKIKEEYKRKSSKALDVESAGTVTSEDAAHAIDVSASPGPAHAPSTSAGPDKGVPPSITKHRDVPSSLAKDIASRRGIPQPQRKRQPTTAANLSPVQATGRMTSPTRVHSDRTSDRRLPREQVGGKDSRTATSAGEATPASDDGFARFYSNLTTGPLSKLSSMLAFAGLPLSDSQEDSPSSSRIDKSTARLSTGPDVDRLFSKAALRALEDQQRHPGNTLGPGESFYVIPTSGGTASYANIASKPQHSGHRRQESKGELTDEFVDAKEVMTDSFRRSSEQGKGESALAVREEELQIENAALKQILDKLSHRLQAFESHAQDASMQALTQSIASVRITSAVPQHEMEERMRAMQGQLEREMKEREKLGLENQKQKQVIAKYRSHWEQLKDSARARERAKKDKAVGQEGSPGL